MNKMRTLQQLRENYLVAVVRGNTEDDAWQKCKQIIEGGILNIEVTFTTPHAETVIKFLSQKYKNDVLIGAGTVMDATTARIAIMNGANFIVSPHFDAQIAMMPSGGVSIENMHEWYEKGAFAIGIGSALTKGAQDGTDRIIVEQTRAFVERFKNIEA
ncbi:2-dehydro-3-deoxyphosphogluconate aldolase [Staphylococcus xylosus]|uniref:hypothetical protein n=1 Tax=Staphylococcus xylosus TaxID=1288 RepID=UPI00049AC306|nr:hypothetical protein [Staphylococcus xylosus]AID41878.1 4-Hydroxy-2-oxoglutarate aldolase [Staphylococcus xylosus]RIM83061.1 2-dehydro-3-deoxyphosphogluconate aldolase [Staphylococcus xylosus]